MSASVDIRQQWEAALADYRTKRALSDANPGNDNLAVISFQAADKLMHTIAPTGRALLTKFAMLDDYYCDSADLNEITEMLQPDVAALAMREEEATMT